MGHRVSAGRLQAWRAVRAEARKHRRQLISLWLGLLAVVLVMNLPFVPAYERGLGTGTTLVGGAWASCWFLWVTLGHALQSNGMWAEDATNTDCRKHPACLAAIPSLQFQGRDIDLVLITGSGVHVVETKWHLSRPSAQQLQSDAHTAAQMRRTLKWQLQHHDGLPETLIRPVLVLWGPHCENWDARTESTPLGTVTVVGGHRLEKWLDEQRVGPVSRDYAADLSRVLSQLAADRDENHRTDGRVIRWLARTR